MNWTEHEIDLDATTTELLEILENERLTIRQMRLIRAELKAREI